jgi:hypothetical protein
LARRSRSFVWSGIVAPIASPTSLAQAISDATQRICGGADHLTGGCNGGIGGADCTTNLFGEGGGRLVAQVIHRIDSGTQLMLRGQWAEAVGESLQIKGCQTHQQIYQQEAQSEEE